MKNTLLLHNMLSTDGGGPNTATVGLQRLRTVEDLMNRVVAVVMGDGRRM